jgi:hypothetical protein
MSAKTGQGVEGLIELLEQQGNFGKKVLDIDYDTYAEGEAELGWLNSSSTIEADNPFSLDALVLSVIQKLKTELAALDAEVAHLKAIGLSETSFSVANLVATGQAPELSLASKIQTLRTDLIVNARVALDPQILEQKVRAVVSGVVASLPGRVDFRQTQSFRPGRPMPTHRYAAAKS